MQHSAINSIGDYVPGGRCILEANEFLDEAEGVGLTSDAPYYGFFEVHAALVLSSGLHDKYSLHVAEEKQWNAERPYPSARLGLDYGFSAAKAADVPLAAAVDGLGWDSEALVDAEAAEEIGMASNYDSQAVAQAEARNWPADNPLKPVRLMAAPAAPVSEQDYFFPLYRSGTFNLDPGVNSEIAQEVFGHIDHLAQTAELKMIEARNW